MNEEPTTKFTLIPELTHGTGPTHGNTVSSYMVGNLPLGQQASIAQRDDTWSIWRVGDGSPDEWHGRYASPDDALAALQAEWGGARSRD